MSDSRTAPSRFNISASLADWIFDIVMLFGHGCPSGPEALPGWRQLLAARWKLRDPFD